MTEEQGTVELGVRITDAAVAGETTVLWCELLTDGPGRCPSCGVVGVYRDSVERRVTDVPVVGHPLELRVRLPRYRCVPAGCDREVFAHDSSQLARPGWSTTRRCAQYILRRLALDKATVTAVARELGRSWDTVNSIAVEATVVVGDAPGFFMTQFINLYIAEAIRLVELGVAGPTEIDEMVKTGLGWPMGVFELLDDTASFDSWYHAQEYLHETCGDRYAVPPLARKVFRAGYRGTSQARQPRRLVRAPRRPAAHREAVAMCGITPARALGRPWQGRFAAEWLASDLALLRADSSSWPSPGNVLVVLDGDGAALIDCGFGTANGITALEDGLRSIGRTLASVHTVLCTHPPTDHAGAAAALAGRRRMLVPAGARAILDDPALVSEAILPRVVREFAPWLADLDLEGHFRSDCGATALAPDLVIEEVEPGAVIRLGEHSWTAVPTPGHDAQLMCYWEHRTGMLVYSDLLVARGTAIPWYAPGGGGTHAYQDSLRRVAALEPRLGISGHGGLLDGASAVAASIETTRHQISARTERVSATLAAGPATFTELERCVYPPAVHEVIPWASSVTAVHLIEALESGAARPADGNFVATRGRG